MTHRDYVAAFINKRGMYFSSIRPAVKPFPILFFLTLLSLSCWLSLSCVNIQVPVTETYSETRYATENRTEIYSEVVPMITTASGEYALSPYIMWSNPDLDFQGGHRYIWYYGYNFSEFPRRDLEILKVNILEQKYYENSIFRVFDMTQRGQILSPPLIAPSDTAPAKLVNWPWISTRGSIESIDDWLNLANIKLNYAKFIGGRQNIWSKNQDTYTMEFDLKGAGEIAILISGPTIPQNARFTTSIAWTDNRTEYRTVTAEHQVPSHKELQVEKQRTVLESKQVPFWDILFMK